MSFFWRNNCFFVIPWIQIIFRQIDYKDLQRFYRNPLKMKIPSKIIWTHCEASSYGVHSLRVILMQFWGWLHFGLISLLNSLICIRGTFIKTVKYEKNIFLSLKFSFSEKATKIYTICLMVLMFTKGQIM